KRLPRSRPPSRSSEPKRKRKSLPGSGRRRNLTSGNDPLLQQVRMAARSNPDWFMNDGYIKIATKKEGLQKLKYKHDQLRARQLVLEEIRLGNAVREFRLKSRQVGMSTLTMMEALTFVFANDFVHAQVVAHEKERAQELLGMAHLAIEMLP